MTLTDELPRSIGVQYATGEEQRNNFRGMKSQSQSENNAHLHMCLVAKVKPKAVWNNSAEGPETLGP